MRTLLVDNQVCQSRGRLSQQCICGWNDVFVQNLGSAALAHTAQHTLARCKHTHVQAQAFTWQRPVVPELRVSTITPASIACLQRAGAWSDVSAHSAAFSTMQVRSERDGVRVAPRDPT
jgi:hypothetical protein